MVVTPIPRRDWGNVDTRVTDVVRRAVDRGAWVLSVCSGSFVIAASGVLDGRRATTHWMYADTMQRMYPSIDVDPDVLYVQDGRIITSAGTAAGLDACLHLLRQELGAELTNKIARRMVVPPQRDGGQAQFIDRPLPVAQSLSLTPVTDWMLDNLRVELTVDQLAAQPTCRPAPSRVASRPTSARRRPPGSPASGSSTPSGCSSRPTSASTASRTRAASGRRRCCDRTSRACSARPRPPTARGFCCTTPAEAGAAAAGAGRRARAAAGRLSPS